MASALLGTLGTIGSSLIGNLFQKGAETLGDVASNKLSSWKRDVNSSQRNQLNKSAIKRFDTEIKGIKNRLVKVENDQKQRQSYANMDEE